MKRKESGNSVSTFAWTTMAVFCVLTSCVSTSFGTPNVILDQQQLVYDGGTSARTLPGYTVWQSFAAGLSGMLVEIDMGFFNNMSGDGVLRIYSGQGTKGAILQVLSVPVVGVTQRNVTWDDWAVTVPIIAGQTYTFELTPNPLTLPDPYGVAIGANNPYPGGAFGLNDPSGSYPTSFDAVFRTYVAGVATPEPSTLATFGTVAFGLAGTMIRKLRVHRS